MRGGMKRSMNVKPLAVVPLMMSLVIHPGCSRSLFHSGPSTPEIVTGVITQRGLDSPSRRYLSIETPRGNCKVILPERLWQQLELGEQVQVALQTSNSNVMNSCEIADLQIHLLNKELKKISSELEASRFGSIPRESYPPYKQSSPQKTDVLVIIAGEVPNQETLTKLENWLSGYREALEEGQEYYFDVRVTIRG
jgi:hypothetical protein